MIAYLVISIGHAVKGIEKRNWKKSWKKPMRQLRILQYTIFYVQETPSIKKQIATETIKTKGQKAQVSPLQLPFTHHTLQLQTQSDSSTTKQISKEKRIGKKRKKNGKE